MRNYECVNIVGKCCEEYRHVCEMRDKILEKITVWAVLHQELCDGVPISRCAEHVKRLNTARRELKSIVGVVENVDVELP